MYRFLFFLLLLPGVVSAAGVPSSTTEMKQGTYSYVDANGIARVGTILFPVHQINWPHEAISVEVISSPDHDATVQDDGSYTTGDDELTDELEDVLNPGGVDGGSLFGDQSPTADSIYQGAETEAHELFDSIPGAGFFSDQWSTNQTPSQYFTFPLPAIGGVRPVLGQFDLMDLPEMESYRPLLRYAFLVLCAASLRSIW